MKNNEAIMAFSQSEKIKSGLIWVSQAIELSKGIPAPEKRGAETVIKAMIDMIIHEIQLARSLSGDETWVKAEKPIEQALVMINSGVPQESVLHLTQALSHVTSLGNMSMTLLKEQGLL